MAMYQKREKKKGTKGSIYEQGINSKIAVFFFSFAPHSTYYPSFKPALK